MKLSRREAIAVAGAGALLAGCGRIVDTVSSNPSPLYQATDDRPDEVRFLDRATFGAVPVDLSSLDELGREEWVSRQLSAPKGDPASVTLKFSAYPIFYLSPFELRDFPIEDVMMQLESQAIIRAVHSPHQVRERLVDFWSNHFSIYSNKGMGAFRKPKDEREVIRGNVFGKFRDMLKASATSTAMLVYLDQQNSTWVQPNENYARELMELHTLGVDGGYSQADVVEVARCFTGWTEERGFLKRRGEFRFDERLHDKGDKTVLGHRIRSTGVDQGFEVVDLLSRHPSTARNISRKLTRHFVGEGHVELEAKVESVFLETDGDITEMTRTILLSEEVVAPGAVFKRPFDYMVGTLRALGGQVSHTRGLHPHLQTMGQPLHNWPAPDGYPTDSQAWSSSVIGRWNFALALASGSIDGVQLELNPLPEHLYRPLPEVFARVFGRKPGTAQRARLEEGLAQLGAGSQIERQEYISMILCDPEMNWR